MKKLFNEFKTFISRGNVVDLAVGVIIGGAFTAIVTALTSHIFQPLINWLISIIAGGDALASTRTMLSAVYTVNEEGKQVIDWASSIYIDWGAFISAIINFLLVAIILFVIVKILNKARESAEKVKEAEKEKYYQKHPEARPVVKEEAPKKTSEELLEEILHTLEKK